MVFSSDIAVIELAVGVDFDESKSPISIGLKPLLDGDGEQSSTMRNRRLAVMGWGVRAGAAAPVASRLKRRTDVEMVPRDKCHEQLSEKLWSFSSVNTDDIVCVSTSSDTDNGCAWAGDAGGPLVAFYDGGGRNASGVVVRRKPLLVGVSSWGPGCGTDAVPGIYTDVAEHREWLEKELGIWTDWAQH